MNSIIKNQRGSGILQVMVAGAVLLGAGVYVSKTLKSQESLHKTTTLRSAASKEAGEISDVLTNWEVCRATFAQIPSLSNNATLTKIVNPAGAAIYENAAELASGSIVEMRLVDYIASSGLRYNLANLRINMGFKEKRAGSQDSFGGTTKTYKIPIYMITLNNQIQTCMSDSGKSINEAMREICDEFGGNFNTTSGQCENLHGSAGVVKKFVSDYFCSAAGGGCTHPYAGEVCPARPDAQGTMRNNWAVTGFYGTGEKICTCLPVVCPNPGAYCFGKDLRTDWCNVTCPVGSWDPTDYGPPPSSVCNGQSFTQTTSCGRTRPATGTSVPNDWSPATSTVCVGTSFTQTNSCGQTRSRTGTQVCTPPPTP